MQDEDSNLIMIDKSSTIIQLPCQSIQKNQNILMVNIGIVNHKYSTSRIL